MKNVTIVLSEQLAKRAKVWAAQHDTSVSRLLGQLLAEHIEREDRYTSAMHDFLARQPKVLKKAGAAYPKRDDLYARVR